MVQEERWGTVFWQYIQVFHEEKKLPRSFLIQLRKGRERVWEGGSGRGRLPAEEVCRLVSRRLLELDDIVTQLVGYGGPAAGMILLCSALNATVMLYLTITKFNYYYLGFITLKVLSIVQVTFIPDFLWCKVSFLHVPRSTSSDRASTHGSASIVFRVTVLIKCLGRFCPVFKMRGCCSAFDALCWSTERREPAFSAAPAHHQPSLLLGRGELKSLSVNNHLSPWDPSL